MTRATLRLPRVYTILDAASVAARGLDLLRTARALRDVGVSLLQYRDKQGSTEVVLRNARAIRQMFAGSGATLILNDHAELVIDAGWDGVHVGHADLRPEEARRFVGSNCVVGLSTHTTAEAVAAQQHRDVDYVAFGPIFATATKPDAQAVVGLAGLREVRSLVTKPLVGIGGISGDRVADVMLAGADAVALISALFDADGSVERRTRALIQAAGS